jgi:hypothetical protein
MEKQELDKLRKYVFGLYPDVPVQYSWLNIVGWKELRSIDSLTDEECIELSEIDFSHPEEENLVEWCRNSLDYIVDFAKSVDYLRSIGIALPYLGHSVEELVQLGIVKLKA